MAISATELKEFSLSFSECIGGPTLNSPGHYLVHIRVNHFHMLNSVLELKNTYRKRDEPKVGYDHFKSSIWMPSFIKLIILDQQSRSCGS